jgi:hypothetical protein
VRAWPDTLRRVTRVVLALVAVAVLAGAAQAGAGARPAFGTCPRGPEPLSEVDVIVARAVVLRFATSEFAAMSRRRGATLLTRGAYVSRALRAPRWAKGGFVRSRCGVTVWRRTVVVGVVFPAMYRSDRTAPGPCNDCAGAEFLASRTTSGWLVWYAV